MNKREAAIVSAYTGVLIGEFSDMHEYVDSLDGFAGITTIGLALDSDLIKKASKQDFINIEVSNG